jgi:outer membrane cobalamin receptor
MAGIVSDNRCYSLKDQFRLNYYFNPRISAKGGIDLDYEQAVADGYSKVETRTRGAVFADADYMPGKKLKLNLLLRQELVDNYLAPIVPSFSAEFKPLKKGLFVLMANASRNFKAPALNDLYWSPGGNPSLRPEEGFSAEAGIAYSTGPSRKLRVEVEITNYHAVISNWILWQPASNGFWGADNLRKVYNRGVEVSMKGTADLRNFKFLLQGNYEYVRAENKLTFSQLDASKGKQLIYVPLHKGNAGLRIIYKRIFAGSDLVFTGLRYITTDNTWLLPSYNTADIFVGANFKFAKLELSTLGRVNNIWNEVYQAIAWRPMPGRNFEISLRFAFIK